MSFAADPEQISRRTGQRTNGKEIDFMCDIDSLDSYESLHEASN